MPVFSFELAILIIGQCLFSILYLSSTGWKYNRWLVLAFGSFFVPVLALVLGENHYKIIDSHFLDTPAFMLLLAPSLYLYTASLVNIAVVKKWQYVLGFLPFLIFYVLIGIIGLGSPVDFLSSSNAEQHLLNISFMLTAFIVSFYFSIQALRLIHLNQKKYRTEFADDPIHVTLGWLKWVLITFLAILVLLLLTAIILPVIEAAKFPLWIPFSAFYIVTIVLSFYAIRQPSLYQPTIYSVETLSEKEAETEEERTVKSKKLIADEEKEQLAIQLENYLRESKPYLNPKIRMPDLANGLGVSTHIFSYLINEHYHVNFFSFINERRVQHACALLKAGEHDHYTLEAIGKLSGFNSRSTFNTRFKEFMGESPKEFRLKSG